MQGENIALSLMVPWLSSLSRELFTWRFDTEELCGRNLLGLRARGRGGLQTFQWSGLVMGQQRVKSQSVGSALGIKIITGFGK